VEEKWQAKEVEWERERRKLIDEAKHLRERLEVLRGMNLNLQKLEGIQRRKAEQTEALVKRCVDLEETNKRLVQLVAERGVFTGPDPHIINISPPPSSVRIQSALA
jgi:predicted ArsR family transcriptional regulator